MQVMIRRHNYINIIIIIGLLAFFYVQIGLTTLSHMLFGYEPVWLLILPILLCYVLIFFLFRSGFYLLSIFIWSMSLLFFQILIGLSAPSGFILNIIMAVNSIPVAFLIGLFLALGEQNSFSLVLSSFCRCFVYFVQGIPFLGIIFFILTVGVNMLPMNWHINPYNIAGNALSVFAGVYLSSVFIAGFNSMPNAFQESGYSLGLSKRQVLLNITLPWLIEVTMPAALNVYVGLFKETSLLIVFGLYDMIHITENHINISGVNLINPLVYYFFCGLCYWLGCRCLTYFGHRRYNNHTTNEYIS